ncbi:MAG: GNAT family N-acetyltransferase [Oscillospiraceae bacterium]|nr:GNAT family N-acetyltransferase [Oscillospiraceae bacterium]
MIREITPSDLDGLLKLYTQLHGNEIPDKTDDVLMLWNRIISDKEHHIIVAEEDGKIVSSCVCVIVPNLTHSQRPYALVENVVTDENYRSRGLATACLDYAKSIAQKENCYKIMLMTGSKKESTLNFYRRAGYNSSDKTAFIQWL